MTLPNTGPISFSQVNVEIQRTSTSLLSLNDPDVRTLAGIPTSGSTISMSNLLGKSFGPVATSVAFSSYSSNGTTFTGNLFTTVGKLYVLVIGTTSDTTYFASIGGWTLGYRIGTLSFFYRIATTTSISVTATKTGTGSYAEPMIYEITGFSSAVPVATSSINSSSTTSLARAITAPQDGTLILAALWQSAWKVPNITSSTGVVNQDSVGFRIAGLDDGVWGYAIERVPAGSSTTTYSWSGAVSARIAVYAIR